MAAMAIEISAQDGDRIRRFGENAFPNECCGFLLGEAGEESRRVLELLPVDNEREDAERYHRFLITAEAYMRGEKEARKKGLDVLGFYHSHPDAPAKPSQYDLDNAWPWYSYIIAAIKDKVADRMTSWVLADDRTAFGEEELIVNEQAPQTVPETE